MSVRLGILILGFLITDTVFAAPQVDRACPDAWRSSKVQIPSIGSSTDPWGSNSSDKIQAHQHLSVSNIIQTVVKPPTREAANGTHLANDLITVASECLAQRSAALDIELGYRAPVGPPPVEPQPPALPERKVSNGHIAASAL